MREYWRDPITGRFPAVLLFADKPGFGPNPSGTCLCGCNGKTLPASKTRHERGQIQGEPVRFIRGHNGAGRRFEPGTKHLVRHGHATGGASREYQSWCSMIQRCTNPNHQAWPSYGGRGTEICEPWRSFEAFLADMGPRPDGMSLDRIDVEGNYEPDNCRWADRVTQARNRRRASASHGL